jgi:hypothetical protein
MLSKTLSLFLLVLGHIRYSLGQTALLLFLLLQPLATHTQDIFKQLILQERLALSLARLSVAVPAPVLTIQPMTRLRLLEMHMYLVISPCPTLTELEDSV